jgi:hypothetical protein
MECSLALFTIEAPGSRDRSLDLESAMQRTAEQATEKDAHWWLVGHRPLQKGNPTDGETFTP